MPGYDADALEELRANMGSDGLAELERKSESGEGLTPEEWLVLTGEPLEFEDEDEEKAEPDPDDESWFEPLEPQGAGEDLEEAGEDPVWVAEFLDGNAETIS